jgi:hypothetical protein
MEALLAKAVTALVHALHLLNSIPHLTESTLAASKGAADDYVLHVEPLHLLL